MTMAKTDKITILNGDKIVELTGADKEAFIAQREADLVQSRLVEAEYEAKKQARENAIKKLAEIAGLTKDEMAALGL